MRRHRNVCRVSNNHAKCGEKEARSMLHRSIVLRDACTLVVEKKSPGKAGAQ